MEESPRKREMHDGTLTVRLSGSDSLCTLELAGELDMANAATLSAALEQAESAGSGTLQIDLSELEFIDSTGLALLVAAHHRLEGSDRLALVPSRSSAVQRVMALTGLDAALPFGPSGGATNGR